MKIRIIVLSTVFSATLLLLGSPPVTIHTNRDDIVSASASTCPDPVEGWYKCWQKLSTINTQIDKWCSYTKSDKRAECELSLLGSINYTPDGLVVKDECKKPDTAQKSATRCYVLIKTTSKWFTALDGYTCGFDNPDPTCQEEEYTAFAADNGWANPAGGNTGSGNKAVNTNDSAQRSVFMDRLTIYLRWLIVGIGILSVFGLVIAGIQYSAAQENPQSVAAAKTRINNIIIGILIYLTMFGMLQWLIPGGVFSF
ncbi:hypothetical protein KBD20_00885 [Candidatus Saccharibacteria bacterium]|nr:hypothetical protein [Candidatus Saccharibacteria bacterium]